MITNPLTIIFLILSLILFMPMVCRKFHVPSIVGFILAGMIIGPLGCNIIGDNGTIAMLGKMGILYIMFQSGVEIDLNHFRQVRHAAFMFGVYSFLFPAGLGYLTSVYILHMDPLASCLMGAMYGSHTLMTYPTISRYGIRKNKAVTIVVGGTMIAITLSLLTLAAVKNHLPDSSTSWAWLVGKIIIVSIIILYVIPKFARWFLKRYQDPSAEFLLIMMLMALSAYLTDWAGLEGILGAFLAGISLNRLLPIHGSLMGRVTLVGSAIFIPCFLLSVGAMIDIHVFFSGWTTWMIAGVMIVTKLAGKWLAALLAQLVHHLEGIERQLIFGLTHAAAAGTLAIITIGCDLGILDGSYLSAAVLIIFVLCTTSSFITEHAAKIIALKEDDHIDVDKIEDAWLVAAVGRNSHLEELSHAATLPMPEYHDEMTWNDISQTVEHISKSVVVYHHAQPLNTINRLLVAVPQYAEKERDFITCFGLVRRLSTEIGANVVFMANPNTQTALAKMCHRPGKYLKAHMIDMEGWEEIDKVREEARPNDMIVLLSSRQSTASYNPLFKDIPGMLEAYYDEYSTLVVYPEQRIGGVDMDTFLMDIPQTSKTWSIVSFVYGKFSSIFQSKRPKGRT